VRHPRYWAKDIILGTLSVIAGSPSPDFNVVLLYHSVGAKVPWAVPADTFRRQLEFLKTHFQVVPLREMRRLEVGNGAPRAGRLASITFDDGALDNYTQAFPALEQAGVKATFFIVTGCIGGTYKATYYETPTMNQSQIKEIAAHGHELGAHSVSHPKLTQIPRQTVMVEMTESKKYLEDLSGGPITTFSYPFGDANLQVRDCAREAGFTCAADTYEALCPPHPADWLRLPRVDVNCTVGMLQFRGKTSPALENYEKLRGRGRTQPDPTLREAESPSR
jgi:peptidoglycan/xylan/chitin deacetylase (PgdA/CDA1 family)